MTLQEFFKEHPKVTLGFSGGVDSSYLLYAAKQAGADVRPYFAKTQFQPQFEGGCQTAGGAGGHRADGAAL